MMLDNYCNFINQQSHVTLTAKPFKCMCKIPCIIISHMTTKFSMSFKTRLAHLYLSIYNDVKQYSFCIKNI